MYGVKKSYDEYSPFFDWQDENGEYLDKELGVVADSMGGSYVIIGHIFLMTESMRWNIPEGFVSIDTSKLEDYKRQTIERFKEKAPEFINLTEGEWKLYTFVHYS